VRDCRDRSKIAKWNEEKDFGYKELYTKSDCVKGESIKGIKDLGARIQEGQE
jgi:hypothetical protein